MRPKIVLADDHGILMEGVRKLIEMEYDIVGTAADGRELIDTAARLRPDIAILDIGMPVLNGIEAARQIRQRAPSIKLVFLTQQSDRAYVQEAFRIGASAYILKQSAASELKTAIEIVLQGGYFASSVLKGLNTANRWDPSVNPSHLFGKELTSRQREVLQLVAEGKSAKEIADVLRISTKTVEFHKAAIMDELGLRTTAELTRYAIEHGIVS